MTNVASEFTRQHVLYLIDAGQTAASIADAAGLSPQTIKNIIESRCTELQQYTKDRILEVTADSAVPGHKVPRRVVCRMLTEMKAGGLKLYWIYERAGLNPKWRGYSSGKRVSWQTYEAIKRVYERALEDGLVEREVSDEPTS